MKQALPYETLKLSKSDQPRQTFKLQDCARSLGMTSEEFRDLCDRNFIPILRPSERRQRLMQDHFHKLCARIVGPAVESAT